MQQYFKTKNLIENKKLKTIQNIKTTKGMSIKNDSNMTLSQTPIYIYIGYFIFV